MRIAVCDDLPAERARLVPMLLEYGKANGFAVECVEYDCGEALLSAFSRGAFDLVLLDIYMGGLSGMETARRLRSADPGCTIIFTTTSLEHGPDAFDVEAFHYLVKPIERNKFFSVLDKWYDTLCEVRTVTLRCGKATREVCIRDILYIDVLGRNCTVHLRAEDVTTAMPLSAFYALLPEDAFYRPIRYCLVALSHIVSVGPDSVTLDNGAQVPISRREQNALREQLAAYRLRALRRR